MKTDKETIFNAIVTKLKTQRNIVLRTPDLFKKHFPEFEFILDDLNSWEFPLDFSFPQKLYHYLKDDKELNLRKCRHCGVGICKPSRQGNIFVWGYNKYCSHPCAEQSKERLILQEKTKEERYGDPKFSNREKASATFKTKTQDEINATVAKQKQTCLERYGDENFRNPEKHKQAWKNKTPEEIQQHMDHLKQVKLKNWGDENYNNPEKRKKTCLERYGAENYAQTDEYKDRYKQTCLEKYGVENYAQTDEYKDRYKQTCLEKYGVEHPGELQEHIDRIKKTTLERYGAECYSQTQECKEKTKQICLKKYGAEYYSQTQEFQERVKQTCLEKYGSEYYFQTHQFHQTRRKRTEYDGVMFDSSWEVEVYKYCKEHNLNFEYQPGVKLTYEYEGKTHFYQPDFLIEGQLYEVKGDHFFKDGKMINPFDRSLDGLFEAKYQCILENGVIILSKNYLEDLDNIFSSHNLTSHHKYRYTLYCKITK